MGPLSGGWVSLELGGRLAGGPQFVVGWERREGMGFPWSTQTVLYLAVSMVPVGIWACCEVAWVLR